MDDNCGFYFPPRDHPGHFLYKGIGLMWCDGKIPTSQPAPEDAKDPSDALSVDEAVEASRIIDETLGKSFLDHAKPRKCEGACLTCGHNPHGLVCDFAFRRCFCDCNCLGDE